MAKVVEAVHPHAAWNTMSVRSIVTVFLYGLGVGLLTYALYLALDRFVFDPILCKENSALVHCEDASGIAGGVAMILGSFAGLVALVRERVYRPIMAILGVVISLWGIFTVTASLPLIVAVLYVALLFAVSYTLFSWLVQPTSLVVSVTGVLVVATLARLAMG